MKAIATSGFFALLLVALPSTPAQAKNDCGTGWVQSGLLCYKPCKTGYKGVGPVCWQKCPRGFPDHGAFCAKPKPYGRGTGYPWKFGDRAFSLSGAKARCERRHGRGKCQKTGLLYYPKCRSGYHNFGCCICSPNCVGGMKDIGVSCAKKSYGRGVGTALTSVKKFVKKVGDKIKKGFQWLGNKIKTVILDKIKAFAMRLYDGVKKLVSGLIGKVLVSLTSKIGFNELDAKQIVDPKTGMYNRAKLQKVVIQKLLTQYLKPIIQDKLGLLIDKGLELIQKPLDAAVAAAVGALGSIPFAGGAIAAAVTLGYSFGIKFLRNFAAKKLSELAVNKLISPLINKGIKALYKLGGPVKFAVDKLLESSERFFKNWVRHPSKLGR